MRNLPIKKFVVMLSAILLLPLATVLAQTQLAQWGPSPEQQERQWQKQERKEDRRESRDRNRQRVLRRCQEHWPVCAAPCNTLEDPNWRAACVANCNNELQECQARY